MRTLHPAPGYITVAPLAGARMTPGGLHLPETHSVPEDSMGHVIAVGAARHDERGCVIEVPQVSEDVGGGVVSRGPVAVGDILVFEAPFRTLIRDDDGELVERVGFRRVPLGDGTEVLAVRFEEVIGTISDSKIGGSEEAVEEDWG